MLLSISFTTLPPKALGIFFSQLLNNPQFCMWRSCSVLRTVLTLWLLIEMRKWGERERKQVVPWSTNHQSPGGSLAKPWKKAWSFFLFLFGVSLLTDYVTPPTHNHWVRLESFPSFLMACICSWHINQTNIVFYIFFPPTRTHHSHLFSIICIASLLLFLYSHFYRWF